jgi:hypothetical protein
MRTRLNGSKEPSVPPPSEEADISGVWVDTGDRDPLLAGNDGDPDPFDPANLRLGQDFTHTAGTKKLLTKVPVRKPHKHDFVRVHRDQNYRLEVALIELGDERDMYILDPSTARALPHLWMRAVLFTTINRQGVISLWPVKLPGSDGRINSWHESAREAAEIATEKWVRIEANQSLKGYDIIVAEGELAEPDWGELPVMKQLLAIAFRAKLVDSPQHAVIQRLHGRM